MAWNTHSPNTIIPQLPGGYPGVSPANVPIPLTPAGQPMQMLPGQGYYIQGQPQMYAQQYQAPVAYQQPYTSPYQQQVPLYGQQQYLAPGGHTHGGIGGMYSTQRERPKLREDNPPLDKFMDGSVYGPVLDGTTATILGVKLQINPVLRHLSEQEDTERLTWSILDSTKEAHIVEDGKAKQWSGRHSAATWPRMDRLYLISKYVPGPIEIRGTSKSGAVTCQDVLNGIHEYMREKLPRAMYEGLSRQRRAKVDATYHYNRSLKAGPDLGTGIRRGDFVEEYSVFDGLEDDPDAVRTTFGLGKLTKAEKEEKTPSGRLKQRPMVGHLILQLEHRDGDDVLVPEDTEAGSPETATNELDDSGEEEEEPVRKKKGKGAKRGGAGNINYKVPQQQPMLYPPGMVPAAAPVMYAPQGYVPVQQMQQPQYLMPMQGYAPGASPAMGQYQLSPNMQGYPSLGTPLPGQQRRL